MRNVGQLLSALNSHLKQDRMAWFRGQSVLAWKLVPSLARNKGKNLSAESAILKRFVQSATPILERRPESEWEWSFLMQHHRAPTRLLDWTESPLVALYFLAISNSRSAGALWCLDPIALNRHANQQFDFKLELPSFADKNLDNYLPSRVSEGSAVLNPIAAIGPRSSARMAAQLGTFTVNHRSHTPIEEVGDGKHIWRYVVPATAKATMLKELRFLGYSSLTIFPEPDRVADLIKREYGI